MVTHSYCPHDLEPATLDKPLKARYNSFDLGGLSLNFLSYGTDVEITPGRFQTFYMLEFPIAGSVRLEYGDSVYETLPGTGTLLSPCEPVRSQWSADCGQVMVKIERRALEQYLRRQANVSLTRPLEFEPFIDLAGNRGGLIKDFIVMLLGQAEKCPDLIAQKPVSAALERALMALMLNNLDHNYCRQLGGGERPVLPKVVSRAQKFIDAHYAEPLTLDGIVAAAGCSERALYAAFRQFLQITPLNYLKTVRFQHARRCLQAAAAGDRVADIAYRSGFTHMGRFAAEYTHRYGEKPSDTLRFATR